jgi:tetrapyrrole methylase family protein/MazG family protein
MTNQINVIGLGAGDLDQLPLGVYRKLTDARSPIFARTLDHPVIEALQMEGVEFTGLDYIYERHDGFLDVYQEIVQVLMEKPSTTPVLYVVPGHPMVAEKTVQLLLEKSNLNVHILGGQSYLDDLFTALQIDPVEGLQFVDATSFQRKDLSYRQHLIFTQVYDGFVASQVKLTLLEDLPETYEIVIIEAAGTKNEQQQKIPLVELDRVMKQSNLTSVYVPPVSNLLEHQFSSLREVIATLRGPDGCPWDKKQTHRSLRRYLLEESYELIDAIDMLDDVAIIEELGDVLLQVMLHSQIGEDDGYFTIDDVIYGITKKMIHRHPHVFGGNQEKSWDDLKKEESPDKANAFLLDDVSRHGSALQTAYQLQTRAGKVGFDWENVADVWEKFAEEQQELLDAVTANQIEEVEEEFGDVLFVLANIAKHYGIQPELALHQANKKFISRFTEVEKQMRAEGENFEDLTMEKWEQLWQFAKEKED